MKILYKFPTRQRSDKFMGILNEYYQRMSGNNPFEFIITADKDDQSMQQTHILEYVKGRENASIFFGDSKTKIEACNADVHRCKDWDILVLVSDDMVPIVDGFDDIIVTNMKENFKDTFGALHFNDNFVGSDRFATLSVMGRKLYEYFGYVYHPAYKSFYCDREFTDVCRSINKIVYISKVIIQHDWYGGPGSKCPLYRRNSKMGAGDKDIYEARLAEGFPRRLDWNL